MYKYSLLVKLIIIILINVNLIKSINLDFGNDGLFLKDLFKYKWNPIKNEQIKKLKEKEESHSNGLNLNDSQSGNYQQQLEDKLSRVELVFGSSGLKLLNLSNVLLLGANELSAKIITHLIRSGVSSITLWDEKKDFAENTLKEIRILNPESNVKSTHTDPKEHIRSGNYSTIIFANQPISEAIKYNDLFHKKCNFVYAFVSGTYGLVINDFGRHEIRIKSDYSHTEHTCKLLYSAKQSCLEVTGSDLNDFKKNDMIEVKYTHQNGKSKFKSELNGNDVVNETFKILDVDKSDKNLVRIWVDTKNKKLPKSIISIKKVDESVTLDFRKIEDLLSKLFCTKKLNRLISSLCDRYLKNGHIRKLVISPNCDNELNNDSLTVLASFMSLNRASLCNLKGDLDSKNYYELTKQIYPNSDYGTVCKFNELKDLKIPAMTALIGGLAAQEAMKSITKMFTPTDLILVDRSDLFTCVDNRSQEVKDEKSGDYEWDLKKSALKSIENVNKNSFLLIGAGALGCEYLRLLAEMKVLKVEVVDNDVVETSNLSRQSLFTQNDIGSPKAESSVRNLKLLHDATQFTGYNMLFTEEAYDYFKLKINRDIKTDTINSKKRSDQSHKLDKWVGISAVDNIEGRLALDGFCTQNGMPLVESGIYGMQCSTSLTVPYVTESFSSSVSGERFLGKYSCSVKGTPGSIDDCVFYSIELFSWLFNGQNVILRNFLENPVKSVELALERGSNYFYTLLQIVNDYLLISKHPINNRHAVHMKASENVEIRKWALRVYDKYVGYETDYKKVLIESLANLKLKSLKQFYPYSEVNLSRFDDSLFDYNKLKSLLSQGFTLFDNTSDNNSTLIDKKLFFDELDRYISTVKNRGNYKETGLGNNDSSNNSGLNGTKINVMVLEEGCKDSVNFIHLISNLRANRFKIPELDRVSILKKAKNIVPAVSTCVSIAASLSLLELYKLPMLLELNSDKTNEIKDRTFVTSNTGECNNSHSNYNKKRKERSYGSSDDVVSYGKTAEIVLNDKVTLKYLVEKDEINFYNKSKLIFKLYPYDYNRNKTVTKYINNYFFNTATLKFVSNISNQPKIYTIDNEKSILNRLSLSNWDYIYVDDYNNKDDWNNECEGDYSIISRLVRHRLIGQKLQNKIQAIIFGKRNGFLRDLIDNEVNNCHNFIYLYELVDLIEYAFDVTVDAITHKNGYVIIDDIIRNRLLKDVLSKQVTNIKSKDSTTNINKPVSDKNYREVLLHIIARDKSTNESIELPDIQYRF